MALRSNHYDFAFQEYLRVTRTPHIVVDESRRALLEEASLKSMDFIVYSPRGRNLLVDVKGRKFPSGGDGRGPKWENWATRDDIQSLLRWQEVFGGDFRAALVFAYQLTDERCRAELVRPFACRQRTYAFYVIWADEYRRRMRRRSESWQTVCLPRRDFRELCLPIAEFL
ncbi:MAG: HYExAFE family protein [Planctomycetaceae bacterium]